MQIKVKIPLYLNEEYRRELILFAEGLSCGVGYAIIDNVFFMEMSEIN